MSRAVRKVPSWWRHPKDERGHYWPMLDGSYADDAREYAEGEAAWNRGEFPDYASEESRTLTYEEWHGSPPDARYYMPAFDEADRSHFMMYEETSEGTPISPAFASPEELARWLAENNASAFGRENATYEQWLRVAKGGYAPSMVVVNGVMTSGVAADFPEVAP